MEENLYIEEEPKEEQKEEKQRSTLNNIKEGLKGGRPSKGVFDDLSLCLITFILLGILYLISVIGVRIAHLIISFINIIDSFKLIYLLSIISFAIFCLTSILVALITINEKIISSIIILLILIIYGMDAWCYFLYINEKIN